MDPSRLRSADWKAALPKLLKAEQLIIDLRRHPGPFFKDFLQSQLQLLRTSNLLYRCCLGAWRRHFVEP